jgi:hypothetical protein
VSAILVDSDNSHATVPPQGNREGNVGAWGWGGWGGVGLDSLSSPCGR